MEIFSHLSNDQLHTQTVKAAAHEKSATLVLLDHLAEIDRRRLHAVMGYSSLWSYVNQELGYSESQAFERISAMRLMVKVPEIKVELQAGNLSLTSAAKLAAHVRREKTPTTETIDLVKSIVGKSSREVERVLAMESSTPLVTRPDQVKPISSDTTRITIDVDQEFLDLMNRVRELKGHSGSSTQELFKLAMKSVVKRHEVKPEPKANSGAETLVLPKQSLGAPKVTPANSQKADSRHISSKIKTKIRLRSGDRCEYVDPNNSKRCDCKTRLEFDHIVPYSLGGQSTFENLRHYCSAHNQLSAIRHFGILHMNSFLKN